MNPLQRKMFMQQGGVVPEQMMAPPPQQMMAPPQQQMMTPPPQQMMAPPENPVAPGPEEVMGEAYRQEGEELVSGILSQVDSSGDYQELMNAIRGNDVPVEGRRQELAELVGGPDAEQTPDSVLTLVQPTMAIVDAQGGLDSLMQGEADVVMEDERGMPTDMAGGVGSMLMAGQPTEPVPMADGGMVRKMQSAGAVNPAVVNQYMDLIAGGKPRTDIYKDKMEQLNPFFKELLGDTEKRREADIGRAKLNFAGDIVSNLFTPTAVPTPFLGRLAPAAKNLATNIGEVVAAERDREDKLDLTTLQTAIAETGADEKTRASVVKTLIEANEDNRTFTETKYDAITNPSYLNNFGSGASNTNSAQTLAGLENVIREKTITDPDSGEIIVLPASTLNRLQARAVIGRNNELGEYSDVSPELFKQAQTITAKAFSGGEDPEGEDPEETSPITGYEDIQKLITQLDPKAVAEGAVRPVLETINKMNEFIGRDAPYREEVQNIDNIVDTLNLLTVEVNTLFDPDVLGGRDSVADKNFLENKLPKFDGFTGNKTQFANRITALVSALNVFKANAQKRAQDTKFDLTVRNKNKSYENIITGLVNSYEMLAARLLGKDDNSAKEIIERTTKRLNLK